MLPNILFHHAKLVTNGTKVWYIAQPYSFLMELEIETKELKCLGQIPEAVDRVAYRGIVYHEDTLILLPYRSRNLYLYDLNEGTYRRLETDFGNNPGFIVGMFLEEELYLLGGTDEVVRYDLKKDKVISKIKLRDYISDVPIAFWWEGEVVKDKLMIPCFGANLMTELNSNGEVLIDVIGPSPEKWVENLVCLRDGKYECVRLGETGEIYVEKYIQNKRIWRGSYLETWASKKEKNPFCWGVLINGKWFLIPQYRGNLFYIDTDKDELKCFHSFEADDLKKYEWPNFICGAKVSEKIITIDMNLGHLIEIDTVSLSVKESEIKPRKEVYQFINKYYKEKLDNNELVMEKSALPGMIVSDLNSYIEYILRKNHVE